jgi:hypothetical protein
VNVAFMASKDEDAASESVAVADQTVVMMYVVKDSIS